MLPSLIPHIGQIVIYNHPGSSDEMYPPSVSPAIILRVRNQEMMEVDLLIFSNFNGLLFQKKVHFGELKHCWSFLDEDQERYMDLAEKTLQGMRQSISQDLFSGIPCNDEESGEEVIPDSDGPYCCEENQGNHDYLAERAARGAQVIKSSVEKHLGRISGMKGIMKHPFGNGPEKQQGVSEKKHFCGCKCQCSIPL